MAIIVMMILPVPSWILDVGLAASFALAILIFTITLFIERPLDFSAFPSVLLASLMLRLSLNVSSTKLIIGEGHTGTSAAGDVIEGFAMFVMGGSIFIGLVVFAVLLIVNFMVITKGAARMAEVGARFALDGMPGKQLAIDADMAAGAIDHIEAKARREREQAETTFFGSLDGASKFVKGDAIAGLLITLLNLVVGLGVGILSHGMPISQAFETYAILTVGDGLVTQIPAVIISIASALLLARGGTTGSTDFAIFTQFGRHPKALTTVAILMGLFALVPGLPVVPFLIGAAVLGGFSRMVQVNQQDKPPIENADETTPLPETISIGDTLDVDEIHVEFAPDLVEMVLNPATGLEVRISNMRNFVATNYGVILPEMRLTDNPGLEDGTYVINILGVTQAKDKLFPTKALALLPNELEDLPHGIDIQEPVYGAPARWIEVSDREQAALSGITIIAATEVLATHLLEVLKKNLARLMTYKSLTKLLDSLSTVSDPGRAEANKRMISDIIPDKVPMEQLLSVLRLMLDEQVSVRNLPTILDAIAELRNPNLAPDFVCERVRQRIGFQLIAPLRRDDGSLPLLQLAPEWEEVFVNHQVDELGGDVALPPDEFNKLVQKVRDLLRQNSENGVSPGIVTSSKRRRFIRLVLSSKGVDVPVFSFEELGTHAQPSLVGVISR